VLERKRNERKLPSARTKRWRCLFLIGNKSHCHKVYRVYGKMKNQRNLINKYQQDGPNQLHFGSPVVFFISVGTLEDTKTSGQHQTLEEWINANEKSDLRYKSAKDIITHIVQRRFQRGIELATFLKDEIGKRQHNFTIRVLYPVNRLPQIQCLGNAESSYKPQLVQITYEQIVHKMFLPYTTTNDNNIVQITYDKTVAASSISFLNSRPDALINDVQNVIRTKYSQPKSPPAPRPHDTPRFLSSRPDKLIHDLPQAKSPSMHAPGPDDKTSFLSSRSDQLIHYLPKAKSPFMPALSEPPGPAVESTPRVMWRHESHLDSLPRHGSQMTRTERKIQTLRSSRRNPCNCML